jgi:hypothetical protein
MTKPPLWFRLIGTLALLWNFAGLFAVIADLRLSAADIAALPAEQQALYAARPLWSVVASLLAVGGGTLGCICLLLRKRCALPLLYASFIGVIVQDLGIFLVAGAAKSSDPFPFVLQGIVLIVAAGLIALAHHAAGKSWTS